MSLNGWSRKLLVVFVAFATALTMFLTGLTVKAPQLGQLLSGPTTTQVYWDDEDDWNPPKGQVYWDAIPGGMPFKFDVAGAGAAPIGGDEPMVSADDWAFNVWYYNCNYDTWCGVNVGGNCCAGADFTALVQNQCNGAVYYGSTQHMYTSWWGQTQDLWFGDATGGYCYRIIGVARAGESSQHVNYFMQGGY